MLQTQSKQTSTDNNPKVVNIDWLCKQANEMEERVSGLANGNNDKREAARFLMITQAWARGCAAGVAIARVEVEDGIGGIDQRLPTDSAKHFKLAGAKLKAASRKAMAISKEAAVMEGKRDTSQRTALRVLRDTACDLAEVLEGFAIRLATVAELLGQVVVDTGARIADLSKPIRSFLECQKDDLLIQGRVFKDILVAGGKSKADSVHTAVSLARHLAGAIGIVFVDYLKAKGNKARKQRVRAPGKSAG